MVVTRQANLLLMMILLTNVSLYRQNELVFVEQSLVQGL